MNYEKMLYEYAKKLNDYAIKLVDLKKENNELKKQLAERKEPNPKRIHKCKLLSSQKYCSSNICPCCKYHNNHHCVIPKDKYILVEVK